MNVNKVMLVGRVGSDPDIKDVRGDLKICNISLATSSGYGDKESTDWHRVTFFGKTAETVKEYVVKGQEIYVEGRIQYRKYTDKQGVEKYSTDIIANQMQLGQKAKGSASASSYTPATPPKEDGDIPF
jgi:single-strand DNA-binding protein